MGEFTCPFCDQQLNDYMSAEKDEMFCDDKESITGNEMHVCRNCGVVDSYEPTPEYINFYKNKIRRKTVYIRKYHISNIINDIDIDKKNSIQISYSNRERILRIFILIDQVLPQVNENRKQMISINYILRQLFEMLWWNNVYGLVKNDVNKIINK